MSVYCWTSVNLVSSQIMAFRANSIELNCNDLSTTDSTWIDFYSSDIILPSKISYCTLFDIRIGVSNDTAVEYVKIP